MEEKQLQNPTQTGYLEPEPLTGKTMGFTMKLGSNDTFSGERIRNIADKTCVIINIVAIVSGIVIWGRFDNLTGFVIGLMIMCVGVFASYVVVTLLYSYGDMITNSIEQTKMLKRLEANKLSDLLRIEQEEAQKQHAAEAASAPPIEIHKSTQPESAREDQSEEETNEEISKPVEASEKNKAPLRGMFDAKMRRVAHFDERSRNGIICPICERIQDSNRNDCYFCDCKFVYDDEPFNHNGREVTSRLRY